MEPILLHGLVIPALLYPAALFGVWWMLRAMPGRVTADMLSAVMLLPPLYMAAAFTIGALLDRDALVRSIWVLIVPLAIALLLHYLGYRKYASEHWVAPDMERPSEETLAHAEPRVGPLHRVLNSAVTLGLLAYWLWVLFR